MIIRKKSFIYMSLILLIFIQMGIMVYFGVKKTDFHEDEYYTYGLANDQGTGFLQIPDRTWQGPSLFADYLTVNENHRFDYPNVWKNQGNDVHPPLYYMFIHTLCSLTPNVMSKWIGISFNLLMFVLCMGVLFITAKKLTRSDLAAWLSCVMFGFSIGAISAVIFIRMYMLFTLWVLCAVCLLIWQLGKERCGRRFYLLLYGITVLGVMTQYYFLIFLFFLSAAFCILLMYQKRWKEFVWYVISMVAAGISCILIFPSMLNHIFFGYRGTEAISNVKNTSGILNELMQMIATVNNELFGGILLGVFAICIGIIFVLKKKNYKFSMIITKAWALTFIASFGYFGVVTKVAPFKTDRYIFPIFPLIVLLFIAISYAVVNLLVKNKKATAVILGTLVFVLTFLGFTTQKVNYVYEDRQIRHDVTKANKGLDTVYITDGQGWKVIGSCTELMNTDKVYYVDGTKREPVTDVELNRAEELLVYVDSSFQAEEIGKILFQNNKYLNHYELLYEGFYSKVYRVY